MPTAAPCDPVSGQCRTERLEQRSRGTAHASQAREVPMPPSSSALSPKGREETITSLLPLARRLASRYRHSGESTEDLEQVAYLGLVKAVDRYEPERGPIVRYAVPTILGELRRHFRDKGWGTHVSRSVQENLLRVTASFDDL